MGGVFEGGGVCRLRTRGTLSISLALEGREGGSGLKPSSRRSRLETA